VLKCLPSSVYEASNCRIEMSLGLEASLRFKRPKGKLTTVTRHISTVIYLASITVCSEQATYLQR